CRCSANVNVNASATATNNCGNKSATRARSHPTRRTRRSRCRAGRPSPPRVAHRRFLRNRNRNQRRSSSTNADPEWVELGSGGVQTAPRAFQRQFHTSFVPVRLSGVGARVRGC
ncbi:hypothetical protein B0H16DRAFT_1898476, partial [Mycena metata]